MTNARIAVAHPRLRFGGSESVALRVVEAVKDRADVTLITGGSVDLARLNEYYGTNIQADRVQILRAPIPPGLGKLSGLRGAYLQRFCRHIAPQFDLMINTYGPCDFGVPAIQCIADFAFVPAWRNALHPELAGYRRWWYGHAPWRHAYLGLCDSIYRLDPEAWKRNLTLANSHWTARLLKLNFGVESQVIYPPVAGNFADIPWEQRENGFVCIGRVVPEKRLDAVIRILSAVRHRGHDVHLHILGGVDNSPFGKEIKQMAAKNSDWVHLEGYVAGRKKEEMIARHRYGINACLNEAFGVAAAELVTAGCITFVPNSGGQTEIVACPELTYENEEDAARKIKGVLLSPVTQRELRRHLAEEAGKFSLDRFTSSIREVAALELGKIRATRHVGTAVPVCAS